MGVHQKIKIQHSYDLAIYSQGYTQRNVNQVTTKAVHPWLLQHYSQ
jgi:hypothetical protein